MGFRGGVKLTPPQHILVFKYPSRDRVKRSVFISDTFLLYSQACGLGLTVKYILKMQIMLPANEHTTVYNDNKNHPFSGKKIHKSAFISPITLCVTPG